MPQTEDVLRALPNPFAFLDHKGLPAATFPFDPVHHSPDRRWVGAVVDRSPAADGQPKTRHLPQPGDLRAVYKPIGPNGKPLTTPDGKPVVRHVHVDRAPRKRIVWAHAVDVEAPHVLPDTPHYRLGFREGSLIVADRQTAKTLGVPYVEPKVALRAAAEKAIAEWKLAYGEPPPPDDWPPNLRAAAGLDEQLEGEQLEDADAEPAPPAPQASQASPTPTHAAEPTPASPGGAS